jgi:hypothetical protein
MAGLFHEFIANLQAEGVAKTSHFQVTIPTIPGILSTQFPNYSRLLAFRCESAELPGRQLATQDTRIYGPVYKIPYQSLYQEVTLTFLETQDLFIRQFFEAWIDGVLESTTNLLNYFNTFVTDISITQFDVTRKTGEDSLHTIAKWSLLNAYPTNINQMPLAWSEDGFHRVTITLAYQYYEMSRFERNTPPYPLLNTNPNT